MKCLSLILPLLALAMLAGGCGTNTETSSAAVEVRRVDPSDPYDPTGAKQPFDPVFLRSQFDVVRSDSILSAVVQSNGLGRVLDAAFGRTPSSKAESDELAVMYLRQHVECRLIRDSPIVIIDVSVKRSVPDAKRIAPKLATDIARAYQDYSLSLRDKAQRATADALRSEIESLEKAIEAGSPEQKAGLEFRRKILLEKLDGRFLAPYIDVRIVEAPVVPVGFPDPATNAPAVDESHAENAESAEPNPHAESARAGDSVTNAAPSFSRRVPLDGFGSAEISPGWRISYGPDEATLDGIPKWSVCVYETAAPLDNRLLPERWHGLQPCEIAPALVPTNEVRVLPVRGKPWLLRLSLEGIGVADGKNVRGEVAMSFHRLATNAPAPYAETAEGAKEPAP